MCYSKYELQRLVHHSGYYSKEARVLFSVWFRIQGIIQNTSCSVWFIIQGITQKWSGYYSAYGSVFRVLLIIRHAASGSGFSVLFKIRTAASGSSFRVLFKRGQGIIQRMGQDSGYYSKHDLQSLVQDSSYYSKYELQRLVHYSGYYSKMVRILFSVWFSIQGIIVNTTCSVWLRIQGIIQNTNCSVWFIIQGIIQKRPGYYSAYGSGFRVHVLFKTRPGAGLVQRNSDLYYSINQNTTYSCRIQGIIQNTTCNVWFIIQGIIQSTTCSFWFIIQVIIQKWPGYFSAYGSVFRVLFNIRPSASCLGFSVLLKKYPGYYSASDSLYRV